MVDNKSHELDRIFYALSDSTRRALLAQLVKKECSVTELAEPHDLTLAGISKHLKVLEASGFVEKTRDGRVFHCRANLEPLNPVHALLDELGAYWRGALDSLEHFLTNEENKKEQHHGNSRIRARDSKTGRKKKN